MITSNPTSISEAISRILDSRLSGLHTALPGRVKSYDATKQTADIEPMISRQVPLGGPEEDIELELIPVLPSVPVLFMSAGGFFISVPLQEGDPVLLIFCERDINHYRTTGDVGDPSTPQTHGLNGAICIPVNFGQYTNTLSDVSSTNLTLGKNGGSANITITPTQTQIGGTSDSAALASRVKDLETAIKNHIHITTATVGATAVAGVISPPTNFSPPISGYASKILKLEE